MYVTLKPDFYKCNTRKQKYKINKYFINKKNSFPLTQKSHSKKLFESKKIFK